MSGDEFAGIVNAVTPPPPADAASILAAMREVSVLLAARDPGPITGTVLTVESFTALMKAGPWPRRVALSRTTADAWRPDEAPQWPWMPKPAGFGVPVEFDETVPDGMVRIVEANPEADRRAAPRMTVPGFYAVDPPTSAFRITGV